MIDMDKCKFTKETLLQVEEHIKACKDSTCIVMAEHDNEYTTQRFEYFCRICGDPLYTDINRDTVMQFKRLICPGCSDEIRTLTLNLRKN